MSSHSSFVAALSALEAQPFYCLTGQSTDHSSYRPGPLREYLAELEKVDQMAPSKPAKIRPTDDAAPVAEPPLRVTAIHSPTSDTGSLSALLRIESGAALEQSPPFNLAIVLDTSGSMEDALGRAKLAVSRVIANLRPRDRLHLVTYSEVAQVVFSNGTSEQKRLLKEHLAPIKAGGGTNIGVGLAEGFKCLRQAGPTGSVFLLSDGMVNEGLTPADLTQVASWLHDHGTKVTTYGLGDQFDEDLMTKLSQQGHGGYFYIAGPSEIDTKIDKGMSVLTSLLATDASFELVPSEGCQLEVFGPRVENRIPVGDICSEDLRQVMVELRGQGELAADWTFSLRLGDGRRLQYSGRILARPGALANPPDVTVGLAMARSAELDKQALLALNNGQRGAALNLKRRSMEELSQVQALDQHQLVSLMLTQARSSLQQMEQSTPAAAVRAINYDRYRGGGGPSIVHRKCF